MIAKFVQDGRLIDYTPDAAVGAGEVVAQGGLVGVTNIDIAAGVLGALAVQGVFDLTKTADAEAFAVGDDVFFNRVSKVAQRSAGAGAVYFGVCVAAAAAAATAVRARIEQTPPLLQGLVWEDVAVDKTLDAQDVGKVMNVTADEKTITLPATAAGLRYVVRCGGADGAVGLAVSPNANDKIMGADLGGADNKDRLLAKATARRGDLIVLVADGSAGWFVWSERGVWSAEA